ncbi:MAG: radical SAM protein [Verrucomicrobiae bacterium]|nr:radical SAM protein [Verrucomicrobiae bacterium]
MSQPEILRYQRNRSLADVPAYSAGLQLQLPSGFRVYLALGRAGFTLTFSDDVALHYDLQGRFTKYVTVADYHRRALSGKILHTIKANGIKRTVLADDSVVERAHRRVVAVVENFETAAVEFARPENAREIFKPLLELAARFDVAASRADAARFRAIYGDVAILPPDQYNALVFQATEGCAYRGCLFCDFYKDRPFRVKSTEEFAAHVEAVLAFHGESWRTRRYIFLGEANALAMPHERLVSILETLRARFGLPVGSFVDAFSRRPDFLALSEFGLRRVYVGMETGCNDLLRWLRKPATAEGVIATVSAAKAAGLTVGVIVLLGAGGEQFAAAHVRETIRVLNAMPLCKGDYIYLSPLVVKPGSSYAAPLLSEADLLSQEQAIRAGLQFPSKPYVARYEVEAFVY